MNHGFDLSDPLVCEGIVGDGCGGGRIFFIEDETLYAHDPVSRENVVLMQNVKGAKKISKSACIITVEGEDKNIKFNLSTMSAG